MIADINNICICYGLFILFRAGTILTRVNPNFISAIETAIIIKDDLNCYKHLDYSSYFCKFCYAMVVEKKIPKFGSANYINILLY